LAGVVAAVLLPWLIGCGADPPLLYCGAGLKPPMDELVEKFEQQHGVKIAVDYRGSEVLLSSAKVSGKGDLYMPGDVHYIELAKQHELLGEGTTVCYFVPVILVRAGNPKEIHTLADLTRDDVKVGLGDPEFCAIGRKTSKLLAKNGVSEDEIHDPFRADTVNRLSERIKLGSLDAVIVWDAMAHFAGEEGQIVPIAAPDENIISEVAVGVLNSSQYPEVAAKFVAFITSDEGRAVFEKHHYTLARPE